MSARKAGTWALPAALTTLAVAWAVSAIGSILTAVAHPAFAYSVAVLYDAVWLYALAQETAHRRQGSGARLPKVIGWVFLPLTVAVLTVHGLMAGDVLAAVVGALVPVLAKMTLVMAVDRDTTRISARAQEAIDRTRATTRDRIAVSRALAAARADETRAAADIVKLSRQAEAEATTTVHLALEAHAEIVDRYPVTDTVPDRHTPLPELVSDKALEALLAAPVGVTLEPVAVAGVERVDTPAGTPSEVSPEVSGTPVPAIESAPVEPLVICGDDRVFALSVPASEEGDGVSDESGDRLPAEAAANVIRAAWVMGTSVAETARQATRSTSYVKKVFARLEESRTGELPKREWPPLKWGAAS